MTVVPSAGSDTALEAGSTAAMATRAGIIVDSINPLRNRSHFHMHVLKHFEFFCIEMTQQAAAFDIQTISDDMDVILRANFPGLVRPDQMVRIDGVAALGVDHQRF